MFGLLPGAQGLSALDACLVSGHLPQVEARPPAPRSCLSSRRGLPVSGLLLCFVLFLDVGVASLLWKVVSLHCGQARKYEKSMNN